MSFQCIFWCQGKQWFAIKFKCRRRPLHTKYWNPLTKWILGDITDFDKKGKKGISKENKKTKQNKTKQTNNQGRRTKKPNMLLVKTGNAIWVIWSNHTSHLSDDPISTVCSFGSVPRFPFLVSRFPFPCSQFFVLRCPRSVHHFLFPFPRFRFPVTC